MELDLTKEQSINRLSWRQLDDFLKGYEVVSKELVGPYSHVCNMDYFEGRYNRIYIVLMVDSSTQNGPVGPREGKLIFVEMCFSDIGIFDPEEPPICFTRPIHIGIEEVRAFLEWSTLRPSIKPYEILKGNGYGLSRAFTMLHSEGKAVEICESYYIIPSYVYEGDPYMFIQTITYDPDYLTSEFELFCIKRTLLKSTIIEENNIKDLLRTLEIDYWNDVIIKEDGYWYWGEVGGKFDYGNIDCEPLHNLFYGSA